MIQESKPKTCSHGGCDNPGNIDYVATQCNRAAFHGTHSLLRRAPSSREKNVAVRRKVFAVEQQFSFWYAPSPSKRR